MLGLNVSLHEVFLRGVTAAAAPSVSGLGPQTGVSRTAAPVIDWFSIARPLLRVRIRGAVAQSARVYRRARCRAALGLARVGVPWRRAATLLRAVHIEIQLLHGVLELAIGRRRAPIEGRDVFARRILDGGVWVSVNA